LLLHISTAPWNCSAGVVRDSVLKSDQSSLGTTVLAA
jgi:hypothetical protein